jgi:ATP-dependent exoDNAse (exonuclease V) alpha subunit
MNNNKQSSVDVLISGLLEYIHEGHHPEVLELYEQAKAMHKEEVEQFASQCVIEHLKGNPKLINEYYNETFGE